MFQIRAETMMLAKNDIDLRGSRPQQKRKLFYWGWESRLEIVVA